MFFILNINEVKNKYLMSLINVSKLKELIPTKDKKIRLSRKALVVFNKFANEKLVEISSHIRYKEDMYQFITSNPKWLPNVSLCVNDKVYNSLLDKTLLEKINCHSTQEAVTKLALYASNNKLKSGTYDIEKKSGMETRLLFLGRTKDFLLENKCKRFANDDDMVRFLIWLVDDYLRKCLDLALVLVTANNRIKTITRGIAEKATSY